MTDSSSYLSRIGEAIASTAKEAAAALKGFSQYSAYVADTGLNSIATRATRGAISLSSSSHLPAIVGSVKMKPVTLPPGRAKLATKPLPIGIGNDRKNDGDRARLLKQCGRGGCCARKNDIGLWRDKLLREASHQLRVVRCHPASVDLD